MLVLDAGLAVCPDNQNDTHLKPCPMVGAAQFFRVMAIWRFSSHDLFLCSRKRSGQCQPMP